MLLYSIRWKKLPSPPRKNTTTIRIATTFLDEAGRTHEFVKTYQEWIGVCTGNIDRVVQKVRECFPGHDVRTERLGVAKKILPYFEQRLETGKLDYRDKPFYKLYTTACHEDVGKCFDRYKIAFYSDADWSVRLYVDLCHRYDSNAFFYKWYDVDPEASSLTEAYVMRPSITARPDWKVAAFDIETVPMDGRLDRVPDGRRSTDSIVMISLFKWSESGGVSRYLLYLDPVENSSFGSDDARYLAYRDEESLLNDFHHLIRDCQVLTGYNINGFDFPCVFARLFWLKMNDVLCRYSSRSTGESVVATYDDKLVVDLYHYFKTFSGYDLPSFKLDDVARVKLGGREKLQVKSTGIWTWYTSPEERIRDALQRPDECHSILNPTHVRKEEFGTFETYLEYCLRDSELVHLLFRKEDVLSFLVERANFTASDASNALYVGNSQFLLRLFQTYGVRLGFYFNAKFFKNPVDEKKYASTFEKKTYQGALNFCVPERAYEDVSVMDFTSMYPSALLSSNLCYGTCTIQTRAEWEVTRERYPSLTGIPYRRHSDRDFEVDGFGDSERFRYPTPEPTDAFVMVVNRDTDAFLPCIVSHFIDLRKFHQREYKRTGDVYHKNAQLCIKILINSLYGVMANKESCLSYTVVAMSIVTLSRYQLLGSFHFVQRLGYDACYADTDSLMVHRWPRDDCDLVNSYLDIPNVELKYEQRMKRLLVLSKKRYVYETEKGEVVTKGFQKKINGLTKHASDRVVGAVWRALFFERDDPETLRSRGWVLWADLLSEMQYMCRDAKRYSIYRLAKSLGDYKSKTCAAVRYLEKHPEKENDYIEYTYGRADVSVREAAKWVVDAEECSRVDYEKLFVSQKKIMVTLLNVAFWKMDRPIEASDMVSNAMRWKRFVHAELLHAHSTGRGIVCAVECGVGYTFRINDHTKRLGRKRKSCVLRSRESDDDSDDE